MELNVGSSVSNFQVKKSHPLAKLFPAILLGNLTGNAPEAEKKRSERLSSPKLHYLSLGFICGIGYIILQLKKKKTILNFTSKEV